MATIICLSFIISHFDSKSSATQRFSSSTLYVVRIITSQGQHYNQVIWIIFNSQIDFRWELGLPEYSLRIMMAIWCLTIVVLSNCYSSKVTSSLTVPKLKAVPNSLKQLAYSQDFKLVIDRGSTFAQICLVKFPFF